MTLMWMRDAAKFLYSDNIIKIGKYVRPSLSGADSPAAPSPSIPPNGSATTGMLMLIHPARGIRAPAIVIYLRVEWLVIVILISGRLHGRDVVSGGSRQETLMAESG